MNQYLSKALYLAMAIPLVACARGPINIEKSQVEQALTSFSEERLYYYLHGGAPKNNAEFMEKSLARTGLRLVDFKPALRRFYPTIYDRLGKF